MGTRLVDDRETSNGQPIVPVRVVEPIPGRGRREVLQTKFGRTTFQKQQSPQMVLPDRPGRVEAYVINNNGFEIELGSDPNVTNWLGAGIPANATSPKIMGPGPVFATTDTSVGQPTDSVIVSTVDIYLVPFDQKPKQSGKRGK